MTERELAFCEAYARSRNVEKSAIEAGYTPTNARKNAWQILNRPHVQEYLNVLSEKAQDSVAIEVADVIELLAAIAFACPTDYLVQDDHGRWSGKLPEKLSWKELVAVKEIRVLPATGDAGGDNEFEYQLHDKMKALSMLYRHLGFGQSPASKSNPFEDLPQERLEALSRAMEEALEVAPH